MLFLFAFLALEYARANFECDVYKCDDSLASGICLQRKNNGLHFEYSLKACDSGKSCLIDSTLNAGTCEAHLKAKYPGEHCDHDSECLNSVCTPEKICDGLNESASCDIDYECNYGLYCHYEVGTGVCKKVVTLGGPCGPSERCDAGLVCNKGKCVIMGSIKEGDSADMGAACETFYTDGAKCVAGPKLVATNDTPLCSNTCSYSVAGSEKTVNLPCVCGMSETPRKYCRPGVGDLNIADVIADITC